MAEGGLTGGGAGGRGMRLRLGAALAVLVVAIMTIDFAITQGSVADVPPVCEPATATACNDERNQAFQERLAGAVALEDDLRARFWVYALVLIAGVGLLTVLSLRATPPEGRREVCTDLGVAGVGWLVVAAVLAPSVSSAGGLLDLPSEPLVAPAVAMIAAAALGTGYLLIQDPRAPGEGSSPLAARIALGLTALTVVLAVIGSSGRAECGMEDPAWTETLLGLSVVTASVAAVIGVVALFQRRWIAALISITVGPSVSILALLVAACLN